MLCPSCGAKNLPGSDCCRNCLCSLAALDLPVGHDRIENSVLHDPVHVLRPRHPLTVRREATLGEALRILNEAEVGAVMVVDSAGRLVGILSERDFLMKAVGIVDDYDATPLEAFMTPNPEVVKLEDKLSLVFHRLEVGGYRHIPVVQADGRPVGIVSIRDVIRHITGLCREVSPTSMSWMEI